MELGVCRPKYSILNLDGHSTTSSTAPVSPSLALNPRLRRHIIQSSHCQNTAKMGWRLPSDLVHVALRVPQMAFGLGLGTDDLVGWWKSPAARWIACRFEMEIWYSVHGQQKLHGMTPHVSSAIKLIAIFSGFSHRSIFPCFQPSTDKTATTRVTRQFDKYEDS